MLNTPLCAAGEAVFLNRMRVPEHAGYESVHEAGLAAVRFPVNYGERRVMEDVAAGHHGLSAEVTDKRRDVQPRHEREIVALQARHITDET